MSDFNLVGRFLDLKAKNGKWVKYKVIDDDIYNYYLQKIGKDECNMCDKRLLLHSLKNEDIRFSLDNYAEVDK